MTTLEKVKRLAAQAPAWVPVLRAACAEAKRSPGGFSVVLVHRRLEKELGSYEMFLSLLPLERQGLVQRVESRSRRPHYKMVDREDIERALAELR